MLSADVSWRHEPGINRAYVWLSDGTVVGYRDLDSGLDHPTDADHRDLLHGSIETWLAYYGVPCRRPGDELADVRPTGTRGGLRQWWRQRRDRRRKARAERALLDWQLDHPLWRVPTDAPHGGWRDLVRNHPGQALWEHLTTLPTPAFFEVNARQEQRAWRTGAMGEEFLAAELWRIARPGQWRFLHSVPVGSRGSDIDHVLIGPAGVFTINTKNHRSSKIWVRGDTFMVNGKRHPYVRNSRHEARRASRLLSNACGFPVLARGVVAVIDPRNITVKGKGADVAVTTRVQLSRWLARQPPVLDAVQVETIFSTARRSSTWSS